MIATAILILAFLGAFATLLVYWKTGEATVPTSASVVGGILALVSKKPRHRVSELGSGFGTLVIAIAKRCPEAQVVGYELSPVPFLISRLRLAISGLENATIHFGNLFDAQLDNTDLVVTYLSRRPMSRLRDKLERELPSDAEVITNTFSVPGWEPIERLTCPDLYRTPVYRYIPPKPAVPFSRHSSPMRQEYRSPECPAESQSPSNPSSAESQRERRSPTARATVPNRGQEMLNA